MLAGDIHVELGALAFIERELVRSPVLYVAGNHEHYGSMTHEALGEAWRSIAHETPGLHFLNGQAGNHRRRAVLRMHVVLGTVGRRGAEGRSGNRSLRHGTSGHHTTMPEKWTVRCHVETHRRQTQAMRRHAGEVDVVVTHWPPTLHALLHPMYADGRASTEVLLNRYFINDEEALVREMDARVCGFPDTRTCRTRRGWRGR